MYELALVLYDSKNPRCGHVAIALLESDVNEEGYIGKIYSYVTSETSYGRYIESLYKPISGELEIDNIPDSMRDYFFKLSRASVNVLYTKNFEGYNNLSSQFSTNLKTIQQFAQKNIIPTEETVKVLGSIPYKKKTKDTKLLNLYNETYCLWRYDMAIPFSVDDTYDIQAMYNAAEDARHVDGKYSLASGNCAHFVEYVLRAGGVICPRFNFSMSRYFNSIYRTLILDNRSTIPPVTKTEAQKYRPDNFTAEPMSVTSMVVGGAQSCIIL